MSKRLHLMAAFSVAVLATSPALARAQDAPRPMSVAYHNAPLRDVLAGFAKYGGRTIVMRSDIGANARVSAAFTNAEWRQALDEILEKEGLVARDDPAGLIRVERRTPVRPASR